MNDRTTLMARAYVEEGVTYAQIGERFGVTRQRVAQILKPLELSPGRLRRKTEREQVLRAAHRRVVEGEVTLARAAADLGYATGETLRSALYSVGLRVVHDNDTPPHGTVNRYESKRDPCRCEDCRRANREKSQERKGMTPPTHGYSGYINYGCRCQVCKEAHSVKIRARRAAKRRRKEVKI